MERSIKLCSSSTKACLTDKRTYCRLIPDDHFVWLSFSVKIHDLTEMKEIYSIITIEDAGGN